ncbi:MAG: zinc-dependent metalloprotease, partial [Planctomycetaceae bacterium]
LDYWKQDYETFTEEDAARLNPNWSPLDSAAQSGSLLPNGHVHSAACLYGHQMQQQMGFAAAFLTARGDITVDGKLPKEFIHQGLKEVVMHEVGHTLGLRHNFKASTWKSLEEIREKGANPGEPIVASVMDYAPANIEKTKEQQGLYYSQTLGPYDVWAIEYGYKPFSSEESKELAKIASRSGEPGHDYATDEDTRSIDSDPLSNRFDMGKEPIDFVRRQMEHASQLLSNVIEKSVKDGQGYQKARQAFGMLLSEYWRTAIYASRFPGGVYVNRDHKGDKDAAPPFEIVEAEKQREAMKLLVDGAFATPKVDGPMLNYLAASRWNHWGQRDLDRLDYPIHEITLRMQRQILTQLLNSRTLQRLHDSEIKVAADDDAYTLAEHLRLLVEGVFTEWNAKPIAGDFSDRQPYIDSFRRNLQRDTLQRLSNLVTSGGDPEDARTLSRMHLQRLNSQLNKLLANKEVKLDDYSKAHLLDCQARIKQVLNAELQISSGGGSRSFIIFGNEPR